MQYRILDKQTLQYKAGGQVASYTIDDDYIVNNNSTVFLVRPQSTFAVDSVDTKRIVTIGGRNYYCYATNDAAYWGLMRYSSDGQEWLNILLVSTNPKAVEYYTDYDDTHFFASNERTFEVDGITYYYSDNKYGMPADSEITNDLYRLGQYRDAEELFNSVKKTIAPRCVDIDYLSNVVTGDIIALIENSGAFHKGVITTIDPTALQIKYKADKELFNDNIPNPLAGDEAFSDSNKDTTKIAGKFGVEAVITILDFWFGKNGVRDPYNSLPLEFKANGDIVDANNEPKMLWTWDNESINVVDWLTELFQRYGLVLSWNIDFDLTEGALSSRKPKYIIELSCIPSKGNILKDNVYMQQITYTERESPQATVCYIVDSETKKILRESSGKNILNPNVSQVGVMLDKNHNTINNNDTSQYCVTDYMKVKPVTKVDDTEQFNNYALTIVNSYDNYIRWIWFYDKDKTRICAIPYQIHNNVDENHPEVQTIYESSGVNVAIQFDMLSVVKEKKMFNSKYAKKNEDGTLSLILIEGETNEEQAAERIAKSITYVRICYANKYSEYLQRFEQEVQFGLANELIVNGAVQRDPFERAAIYYLYENKGEYLVSKYPDDKESGERILPVKKTVVTYNPNSSSGNDQTPIEVAREKLIPSQFNQSVEVSINSDSKMFDFQYAKFGDLYTIINNRGTIDSIFTGKKITSTSKWVTLYFGLGRQNYSDLIQIRLRKQRYRELFNQ